MSTGTFPIADYSKFKVFKGARGASQFTNIANTYVGKYYNGLEPCLTSDVYLGETYKSPNEIYYSINDKSDNKPMAYQVKIIRNYLTPWTINLVSGTGSYYKITNDIFGAATSPIPLRKDCYSNLFDFSLQKKNTADIVFHPVYGKKDDLNLNYIYECEIQKQDLKIIKKTKIEDFDTVYNNLHFIIGLEVFDNTKLPRKNLMPRGTGIYEINRFAGFYRRLRANRCYEVNSQSERGVAFEADLDELIEMSWCFFGGNNMSIWSQYYLTYDCATAYNGRTIFGSNDNFNEGDKIPALRFQGAWNLYSDSNLTNLLNSEFGGIPWSYAIEDVESKEVDTFPDYEDVSKGQKEDTTGGGQGTGDNSSGSISWDKPGVTALNCFNKTYAITPDLLQSLCNYLWGADMILHDWKSILQNPGEALINCKLFPFNVMAHDPGHVGGAQTIIFGNVKSNVSAWPIKSGYNAIFDLGTLSLKEYFGTFLDYSPYTKVEIYLPYIGFRPLNTNDVMGQKISVQYAVDITTGKTIANIFTIDKKNRRTVIDTFESLIGCDIPMSSSNASRIAASVLQGAATATIATAAGGLAAGSFAGLAGAGVIAGASQSAQDVVGSQLHIDRGGMNTPFAAFYMPQYAFLVVTRPIQSYPSTYAHTYGRPANISRQLSTVRGMTVCDNPILNGIPCFDSELAEIKQYLTSGVIL